MTDENTRIETVEAARNKEHPTRIAAPIVETLTFIGIARLHRHSAAHLKIKHPQVRLLVPDMESAEIRHSHHKIRSVIRRTRSSETAVQTRTAQQSIHTLTELTSFRVKSNAAETVLQSLTACRHRSHGIRTTEIKGPAIRRKSGISLKFILTHKKRRSDDLTARRMIDNHIRSLIINLNPAVGGRIERLTRSVDRIGYVLPRRMPVRIDEITSRSIALGIKALDITLIVKNGSRMRTTDMGTERRRVSPVGSMAIHTVRIHGSCLKQRSLLKRRKLTLINAHRTECLIAGHNLTVSHGIIYRIPAHIHPETFEKLPGTVNLHSHTEIQIRALVGLKNTAPLAQRETRSPAAHSHKLASVPISHNNKHTAAALRIGKIVESKIERSYVVRNGHINAVRKNGRKLINFLHLRHTGTEKRQNCQKNEKETSHPNCSYSQNNTNKYGHTSA